MIRCVHQQQELANTVDAIFLDLSTQMDAGLKKVARLV